MYPSAKFYESAIILKIFVEASNINTGGGKVLLDDFICCAESDQNNEFVILTDKRYRPVRLNIQNIRFLPVAKLSRPFLSLALRKMTSKEDLVVFFGNLPPVIKPNCKSCLIQSNRFVVEWVSTKPIALKHRLRINFERLLFKFFQKNVERIFVQSKTMLRLCVELGISNSRLEVLACRNSDQPKPSAKVRRRCHAEW